MTKYWLVKHDKVSIEARPGWIWKWAGSGKKPPHYNQVQKGDKFVLYAYKTDETKDSVTCSEIYGFYTVNEPISEKRQIFGGRSDIFWVIVGRPIIAEGWVSAPSATEFFSQKKYHPQSIIPLSKDEYLRFPSLLHLLERRTASCISI